MKKMIIKPNSGLVIRDPETFEILPEEGKPVDMSSFWKRRLLDGDVSIVKSNNSKKKTKGK